MCPRLPSIFPLKADSTRMPTWPWRSVCRCAIGKQLTNLLADVYNPASPNFHHYLTPDQFTASFGPSQEDYQKVIDFAKSHGLVVKANPPEPHVAGCLRVGCRY